MKTNGNIGACGWQHSHWLTSFYPDELPADWQLTYYSNEFSSVLIPASYWENITLETCHEWCEEVNDEFQFVVELHTEMFKQHTVESLLACLQVLKPHLAALIFLDDKQVVSEAMEEQLIHLVDTIDVDTYGRGHTLELSCARKVQPFWQADDTHSTAIAIINDDLKDLRQARALFESYIACLAEEDMNQSEFFLFFNHAQLQPEDLSKFRSVIEIMGY